MILHDAVAARAVNAALSMKIPGEQSLGEFFRCVFRSAQGNVAGHTGVRAPIGQIRGVPTVNCGGNAHALSRRFLAALDGQAVMAGTAGNNFTPGMQIQKLGALVPIMRFQNSSSGVVVAVGAAEAWSDCQYGGAFRQQRPVSVYGP